MGRCKYKSHGFVTLVVFLSLEVRQGAWTALIRRGRLVRSQLQRRKDVTPCVASVMVARRSWRGASDCKSDVSAEWVRVPPPPLETRLSLLKMIDMG